MEQELIKKWKEYKEFLKEKQSVRDEERYYNFRDFMYWLEEGLLRN